MGGISQIEGVSELMTSSPTFASLVSQFPLLVTNIVVFLLIFYILKFLTWFIYAIVSSIVVKNKMRRSKEIQKERELANGIEINYYDSKKPERTGRDKGIGALIGLAQGFVLALVFFLPFNGIVNTYFDVKEAISPSQVVLAEETSSEESQFDLTDYIPQELDDLFTVYRSSAASQTFGFLKVDRLVFDYVSSIKVGNERIVLAHEIKAIANTVGDINYFMNLDLDNIDLETFDFTKLEAVVRSIFDSKVVSMVAPELLDVYGNKFASEAATGDFTMDEAKLFIPIALSQITSDTLKSDILAIISTLKEVQTAGIFGAIKQENVATAVLNCLTTTNATRIFNAMLSSQTLKQAIVFALNEAYEEANGEFEITITELSYDNVNWSNVASSIGSFVGNIASNNLVRDMISGVIDTENTQPEMFLDGTYKLKDIGKILDIAKANPLFADALNKILMSFENDPEVSKYLDVATLASLNYSFETEFNFIDLALADINAIKNVENVTLINLLINGTITPDEAIDLLNANIISVKSAINNLLSISIFQNSADKLFTELTTLVATKLNVQGSVIDLTNINWTDEKAVFTDVVEDTLSIIDTIGITAFTGESIDIATINQYLPEIGAILDIMTNSKLLSGVYTALTNYLSSNEQIQNFVNTSAINEAGFSWETEFTAVSEALDVLVDNNLLDSFSISNIKDSLKTLSTEDVNTFIDAIIDSKLLSDIVIDAINEVILAINQSESLTIPTISSENLVLSEHRAEIKSVLDSMLPIIDTISVDISIDTIDANAFGGALNALRDSNNNNGLFSGLYNGLIDFMKADATYGAEFTQMYDAIVDKTTINWIDIINQLRA